MNLTRRISIKKEGEMKVTGIMKGLAFFGAFAILLSGHACKGEKAEPAKAEPAKTEPSKGVTKVDKALLEKPAGDLTAQDMSKMIAVIETNHGTIKFRFFPDQAPGHCRNFIKLARQGFYDNLIFHRVIKGFMIQGGCPKGDGTGGPGWNVRAEFNENPHLKGTVSMARARDPNSAGSQFFICLAPQPSLDGQYTVFGQVAEGQEVVDAIGSLPTTGPRGRPADKPLKDAVMKKVYIELASVK
jgi:peptidyl-prolyl cis-trans isomerase B (cyclophilin B)